MRKIYFVKVRGGTATTLPGRIRGDGDEYLVECLAFVQSNGRHCFMQAFSSNSVDSSLVESYREVSHEEALRLYAPPQPKKRDPGEVIEQILKAIPEGNDSLRQALQKIQFDAGFLPPEGKRSAWVKIVNVLVDNLLPIDDPDVPAWHVRISEIVRGVAQDPKASGEEPSAQS